MCNKVFSQTLKCVLGCVVVFYFTSTASFAMKWSPKDISGVFNEIADPYVAPPNGSSGAPRHGWLNTFNGFFTKEWHAAYSYTRNLYNVENNDRHIGIFRLQLPLSRRAWVGLEVPATNVNSKTDLGDIKITPKLMLYETRDVSISTGLGIGVPSGKKAAGGNMLSVFPHIALWTDIGHNWSVRGGVGVSFYPENKIRPDEELVLNLSIGHTFSRHDMAPLGDFTVYLAGNLREPLSASHGMGTYTSLTPGIRTHLGKDIYLLSGVEVPTSGPNLFDEQYFTWFVFGL